MMRKVCSPYDDLGRCWECVSKIRKWRWDTEHLHLQQSYCLVNRWPSQFLHSTLVFQHNVYLWFSTKLLQIDEWKFQTAQRESCIIVFGCGTLCHASTDGSAAFLAETPILLQLESLSEGIILSLEFLNKIILAKASSFDPPQHLKLYVVCLHCAVCCTPFWLSLIARKRNPFQNQEEYSWMKKRVALIMLIIALQFDVSTSKKKKRVALIMLIIALMNWS